MNPDKVDFKMKILSTHQRQLRVAVLLEHFAGPLIMKSKLEYTRCGIPKIDLKIVNNENKENTPTGASTNPKNMKLKHEIETWNWNLELKLEIGT